MVTDCLKLSIKRTKFLWYKDALSQQITQLEQGASDKGTAGVKKSIKMNNSFGMETSCILKLN